MPKLTAIIDRLPLFKGRYENFNEVKRHEPLIRNAQTVEEWDTSFQKAIVEVLKPIHAGLLRRPQPSDAFQVSGQAAPLRIDHPFIQALARHAVLVRDFLDESVPAESIGVVREEMGLLKAEVSAAVMYEGGVVAVLNIDGKVGGTTYNDLDMTALWGLVRIAEETLRDLFRRESLVKKERLAAIGEMASVVSHELKTPLAVIKNSAYFLENRLSADGVDQKVQKHLGIINDQTQSLNDIISGILDYTRSRELRLEKTSLNGLIKDLLSVMPIPPNVQIALRLDDNLPDGMLDKDEIRQALTNLLNNAIQAMPDGGPIEVLTAKAPDGRMEVRITDAGCGIPPEDLSRIFEPFFTTKSGGTGLGMAVVKKVVERHKGEIRVQSVPGKGTAVNLFLSLGLAL
jgi:signal transduction histidine kinase